jgi:asparagine synthase (glutamine-hydrolysing)
MGAVAMKIKPGIMGEKYNQLLSLPSGNVADTFPVSRQISTPDHIAKLLNFPMPPDRVAEIVSEELRNNKDLGVLSQVSVAEITTYMQNILLRDTDQMSMASALEVRVPFLDYELVEYVMGIDDEYKTPSFLKNCWLKVWAICFPMKLCIAKKWDSLSPGRSGCETI